MNMHDGYLLIVKFIYFTAIRDWYMMIIVNAAILILAESWVIGGPGEGGSDERDRRCQRDSAELQGRIHGVSGLPALPSGNSDRSTRAAAEWREKMRMAASEGLWLTYSWSSVMKDDV
jgi:hypothetical protein